jgi:hypothetical protein
MTYTPIMERDFQQSFVKPNENFGVCANDVDNTGIILKSNPRGLGCIFKATLDTTELASRLHRQKS